MSQDTVFMKTLINNISNICITELTKQIGYVLHLIRNNNFNSGRVQSLPNPFHNHHFNLVRSFCKLLGQQFFPMTHNFVPFISSNEKLNLSSIHYNNLVHLLKFVFGETIGQIIKLFWVVKFFEKITNCSGSGHTITYYNIL